jgi:hypothetical protein
MARSRVIDSVGLFDEQFVSGCDFDFAIRLASNGEVRHVGRDLGDFLDEGAGLSTLGGRQQLEMAAILVRYGNYLSVPVVAGTRALRFNVDACLWDDQWHPVLHFCPELLRLRQAGRAALRNSHETSAWKVVWAATKEAFKASAKQSLPSEVAHAKRLLRRYKTTVHRARGFRDA